MASVNLDLIATTAQRLLSQTTTLLQQDGPIVLQDETLETLEKDVRWAMMQLRRRRNSSIALAINRLPPELLRMVFGHLRNPPSTRRCFRYPDHVRFSSYKPLISAMLVCHKWRTIASEAASLWTDIHMPVAEVLLSRSLGAPIRLDGRLSTEDTRLEGIIKDNGARIRELDLCSVGVMPALQSILAVDMPQLRAVSLFSDDVPAGRLHSLLLTDVPASFPALKALMLKNVLFVPSRALPQLTHLYLDNMRGVCISNILDLLRNTPALEVLDIAPCRALITPLRLTSPSVALPRLHNVHIRSLASICVHHLMRPLEAPALTFLDLSMSTSPGAFVSMALVPRALTTWTVDRLAISMKYALIHAAFRGNNVSLDVELVNSGLGSEEKRTWLRNDLPTMLPLSDLEELHFIQTGRWDMPARESVLAHLAPYMLAVSTLVIKHDAGHHDEEAAGVTRLAQTVAELLETQSDSDSDSAHSGPAGRPVLFPNLAHLELIVSDIPLALCEHLAPVLERRDRDGRRLRTLRIRVDDDHSVQWQMKRLRGEPRPAYAETGVFEHVDECEIYPRRGGLSYEDYSDRDDDTWRLGWGEWKGCVERAQHEYWDAG